MKDVHSNKSARKINNTPSDSVLQIVKVTDRKSRNTFIRLPWFLYKDDPVWVPPLLLERRTHLSPKNPYFDHATCCFWIALRDGEPVGRISAQVDRLHLEHHQDDTGFWGMLEAEDNIETFRELLNTAESWLHTQGMKYARGPFNLSVNQECGLLINGFDSPPSMMMGHARPYYAEHIEQCDYSKEKDLLAYMIQGDAAPSTTRKILIRKTRKRIQTRTLRKSHFHEDLKTVFSIFNDAWSQNWGFVPFTPDEFAHLAKDMKLLINEQFVRIAYVDDVPAAFIVMLPNLNEVIQDLNGALFPFGWLKMLWRLKIKYPQSGRIMLMGVLSEYQESLLGAALAYRVISDIQEAIIKCGIKEVELSWVLEDNVGARGIIEDFGGRVYKTYRIYRREL
jgi:hypothetical protein